MEDILSFAESIVETVREPLIVLNSELRVRSANRSFYRVFEVSASDTENRLLYELGNGQWNIPRLRVLLEEVLPTNTSVQDFEVEHHFPGIGRRIMLLNARRINSGGDAGELILLALEDITDRKHIQRSERLLAAIVESSEDAIISKNLDGVIQTWNAAAERIFGYTAEQAIGQHISILIPEERIDEEDHIISRIRAGERVEHFNTIRLRSDGRRVAIALTISPIRDATGQVTGASKIARDITEREQTEKSLRESDVRKAAMLETALDGIITIDHCGLILEFNPAAERMFGYTQQEVLGREMAALIIPEAYREFHRQGISRYSQTGDGPVLEQRLELSALRADGHEFPVELAITRISQDDPPVFTGYVRDITDRRIAEEKLREHEQRFRTLVEQVEDYAIFMTDPLGRATTWNEGVHRILGFLEPEFIGQDIVEAIFLPEDVCSGVAQAELNKAAADGKASDDRWMTRKDGTRFWAAGMTTGLRDEQGQLLGFMKVMRDQTERKHLESELRQIAADLSESNRRKTEFLATLGHELRNPLAPIRTGLEVLRMAQDDPEIAEEVRDTMERQVLQMVRLIDDLLDVSRITRGKIELRMGRVALADVVRSAVEATRPFIDEAGHQLMVSLPQQPISLDADPNRLTQVISNLLNNASKYTPDSGHIWLAVEQQGDEAVIRIKDDGLGIPADMKESIFEMFTQIERPLGEGCTGLGIGLTLVKQLVEMHQGSVVVESEGTNRGSEFIVRLPIREGAASTEASKQHAIGQRTQLRVLVVDDNQAAATMLKLIIKQQGNDVRTAHDGRQAIEVAEEFQPDVILMDIGMPHLNGYEAARYLREQPWGQDILLVALTGWGQAEDKERTKQAGFDHHFVKPADPAALQQLLASCTPRSR